MNLTTNKWNSKKMGLNKHTFEKTQACKNMNTKWKFKSSTMFVLARKRNNKHTM